MWIRRPRLGALASSLSPPSLRAPLHRPSVSRASILHHTPDPVGRLGKVRQVQTPPAAAHTGGQPACGLPCPSFPLTASPLAKKWSFLWFPDERLCSGSFLPLLGRPTSFSPPTNSFNEIISGPGQPSLSQQGVGLLSGPSPLPEQPLPCTGHPPGPLLPLQPPLTHPVCTPASSSGRQRISLLPRAQSWPFCSYSVPRPQATLSALWPCPHLCAARPAGAPPDTAPKA